MKVLKKLSQDGRPYYKLTEAVSLTIPGDIHIPMQDQDAVDAALKFAAKDGSWLFITGDLIDYYWLSSWPKSRELTTSAGYTNTLKAIEALVLTIDNFGIPGVVYGAGNHEERVNALSRKFPGFDGNWYWMFEKVLPENWVYLDHGYRCELAQKSVNGLPIIIEHGDRAQYGGVPSAEKLVTAYPGQCTIIGHNHRIQQAAKTTWKKGTPTISAAYTVGHLSDIKQNNYAANPNWQQGWASVSSAGLVQQHLYDKGKIIYG